MFALAWFGWHHGETRGDIAALSARIGVIVALGSMAWICSLGMAMNDAGAMGLLLGVLTGIAAYSYLRRLRFPANMPERSEEEAENCALAVRLEYHGKN